MRLTKEREVICLKTLNLMAMDFGASNGRGVLGRFDGKKITMEEIHRFPNYYVPVNGLSHWDTLYLFEQIRNSLALYRTNFGTHLDGIGVDTWGVDYGLLDKNGQICGYPISYRDATDETMHQFFNRVMDAQTLFERTGLSANNYNTIYQLYARLQRQDSALETAKHLLLLPDLFAYLLSGELGSEYTMAMTTQLCNPSTKDWDRELIAKIGIHPDLFLPVTPSASRRGVLRADLASSANLNAVPVLAVGGHDTASAVAAIPMKGKSAFLSSGTWSLLGIEHESAILSEKVYRSNYSNEGTVQGTFRPLKNIMGLWIIQQIRREWLKAGNNYEWSEIVEQAKQAKPFVSFIDPDHPSFFSTNEMISSIQSYCQKTNQVVPETPSELARCVYQSLALKYRWALERLEEIKGEPIDSLNIVGGGCQNLLLNQMTANAIQRPVITGPVEGASIGNLLTQAMSLGELANLEELREVVRNSVEVEEYFPEDHSAWEDAYGRFVAISKLSI